MAKRKTVKKKLQRIDVHSHVVPAEIMRAIERDPARYEMRIEVVGEKTAHRARGGQHLPRVQ